LALHRPVMFRCPIKSRSDWLPRSTPCSNQCV
jgi:hypothetical protein